MNEPNIDSDNKEGAMVRHSKNLEIKDKMFL